MINMGHCRFENTYLALCECIDALQDNDWRDISESEYYYARQLKGKCEEFIEEIDNLK